LKVYTTIPHTAVSGTAVSDGAFPIGNEIDFWSHQLSEHALFMQLGLDDKKLKSRAEKLHREWEKYRSGGSRSVPAAIALVHATRELKMEVHSRLVGGEWLGWLWPLFIDHVRREGDYFLSKLHGTVTSDAAECSIWLTFMAEHAAFAAHLLDPSEAKRIHAAIALLGDFTHLQQGCSAAISDQMLSLSTRSGLDLDAYFKSLDIGTPGGARSIIHPALAAHVVREGHRFLMTIGRLQSQI
jgi:hypothetical protein